MDKIEAIKILTGIRDEASESESAVCYVASEEDVEAIDMAIEALKQDRPKGEKASTNEGDAESATTTDCISRQAAIEAFCDDCRGIKPGQCEHWDSCKSQKELRSLPPIEPKIYGNEHNCIMTLFGECSYPETGCGDCAVVEKVRDALKGECPPVEPVARNATPTGDCISRQATISALQKIDGCTDLGTDDLFLSMGMAVKRVLSLPPVEPKPATDDCISRQAMIEVIEKYDFDFPEYMEKFVTELRDAMKKDLLNEVKLLSPVEPVTSGYVQAEHTEGGKK